MGARIKFPGSIGLFAAGQQFLADHPETATTPKR